MARLRLRVACLVLAVTVGTKPGFPLVTPRLRDGTPRGIADPPAAARVTMPAVWFVELASAPLAEANPADQPAYLRKLRLEKEAFRLEASRRRLVWRERFTYNRLWNGVSLAIDPAEVMTLAQIKGVTAIYPVTEVEPGERILAKDAIAGGGRWSGEAAPASGGLAAALSMVGADRIQAAGIDGAGVRVALIDTGIDYLHPDLGGGFGPGFRVEGGFDLVGDNYRGPGNTPLPDADPRDCNGHGTHVAGILAGRGAVTGVAPGATLRAYKVFGCVGGTLADIVLAAMERVLGDGSRVVNLSLGNAFQWPHYPTARAADNLVNHGVVVVASAGNDGDSGLFSLDAPGVGRKTIGVASTDSAKVHTRSFRVLGGGDVGYFPVDQALPPPLSGSALVQDVGHGCLSDRALFTGVAGKVAVMSRGQCAPRQKVLNLHNAGAAAVLIYNDEPGVFLETFEDPPIFFPVATLSREDGTALAARARFPTTLVWTSDFTDVANATGGLVSPFSAYGESPDLELKPDLAAPGALVFSTLPLARGSYGLRSGTSMAAPFVAGAAALLIEAEPNVPSQRVRDILQNAALPRAWRKNPDGGGLEPIQHEGAGLVDVEAALQADLRVGPGKISLGEMEGASVRRALEIENRSASALALAFSHAPAKAVLPGGPPVKAADGAATVSFDPSRLVLPAGGKATVEIGFTPPEGLPEGSLFGGFLAIAPEGAGRTVRVPYAGFQGDYQSIVAMNPDASPFGNPILRPDFEFGPSSPLTIEPLHHQAAIVLFHLRHPVRRLRLELFDTPSGRSRGRLAEAGYFPRNGTAEEFFFLFWDGRDSQGDPLPAGSYVLRLAAQKALGDDDNPAHWEIWTSPPVTVLR
ncbi:MAG TPA: S8 family serine peptidase [Candidatus Polarisedimenticolia bacterium]|jgi:subtilisin family serine protease|nr:S8 family serine peptidase [Candidatus Polarisedimenticolia bacterium]